MNKELRQRIYKKYNGLCAYSGTPLKDDWQVDHIEPKRLYDFRIAIGDPDVLENLMPVQRIINHYKGALSITDFKKWYLGGLHKRLAKLPKNPKKPHTIRHKEYLLEVAVLFNITSDNPFTGKLYFEIQEPAS